MSVVKLFTSIVVFVEIAAIGLGSVGAGAGNDDIATDGRRRRSFDVLRGFVRLIRVLIAVLVRQRPQRLFE